MKRNFKEIESDLRNCHTKISQELDTLAVLNLEMGNVLGMPQDKTDKVFAKIKKEKHKVNDLGY